MHATHILYQAAQPPATDATHTGTCRICGDVDTPGIPFDAWVPATFTNHDQLRPGDTICTICQFAFAQGSTFLAAKTGKDKPQKMQNYSHIVLRGKWYPLHKGQKAEILALLRQSPELVAISTSGQKHVVFRTRPGWWQVEEQSVLPDLRALDVCLSLISKLYAIYSKEEIASGNYSPGRTMQYVQAHGLDDHLATDQAVRQWRGTAYFDLALYLAQKENTSGDGTDRLPNAVQTGIADVDPALAGAGTGVQAEIRPQHLGAVRGQHTRRSVHQQPEPVLQQSLFALGDSADSE